MTTKLITTTILLCSLLFFGCQKELSSIDDLNFTIPVTPAPITADIDGVLLDETGQPRENVAVQVGSETRLTDENGYFRIADAQLDKRAALVTASHAGYYKAYRVFPASSGQNHIKIKLIKKTLAGSLNAGAGGEVTLSNGSQVKLPTNSVVRLSDNTPYSGTIRIYADYIDPTSTDIAETVPGSFMATDKDGKRVTLASFGMVAVELETVNGERLQIAAGKKAGIKVKIPDARAGASPANIALWSVDETTGIWEQEGTAQKAGNFFEGEVSHFSFWNCDVALTPVMLTLKLRMLNGTPIPYTRIDITTANFTRASGFTDSEGDVNGYVPANQPLTVQVIGPCNTPVHTQQIGPYSNGSAEAEITITDPNLAHTVTGRAVSCAAVPVSQGFVVIYRNNNSFYQELEADGTFELQFLNCSSSSPFQVVAVNEADNTEGILSSVIPTGNLTAVGDIQLCGTVDEFIDLTIDAVNINVTRLQSDSLYAALMFASQDPDPVYHTKLVGVSTPGQDILLHLIGTATNVQIREIVHNGVRYFPATSVTVTVTSHATTAGEFVSGTFNGEFRTQADPQPRQISASYKARRIN